jgi:hypothetical protein
MKMIGFKLNDEPVKIEVASDRAPRRQYSGL